ncbi:Putative lipoyltransferase-like protein, chloroplastic [Apostasia shenzhenica]|uniref:Lipoyltransferase-like protein, chloroplastic n=1 Tax=Apostasia shenzhenica TaxID=1088818 RepID=A0A2I0AQD6_9ASPA|nr:Putative lipoyltransferase-like protein, chloroplastic [Apostasia shenzhenica]
MLLVDCFFFNYPGNLGMLLSSHGTMMLVASAFVCPVSSYKLMEKHRQKEVYTKDSIKLNEINCHAMSHDELRRCECFDLYKDLVPYEEAWSWQKSLVRKRHNLIDRDEDHCDTLIVLQHLPVYTLGTGSSEKFLNFDSKSAPYDLYRTERGGEVTYHGNKKLAAVGIRVSRWVTYHGLALNVNIDLSPFQHIIPCGLHDREVGSLSELLGLSERRETTEDMDLLEVTHDSLLKAFSEVFQLSLDCKTMDLYILEQG